jgi:iron complex outermembrane receptor protein
MNMNRIRALLKSGSSRSILFAVAALPFCVPTQSHAQSAVSTNGAQQGSDSLQEIVVTATKREALLSKVPASITAFSQATMDVEGIKDVQDIVAVTPGISFNNLGFASTTNSTVSVRGIASKAGTSTTGVYIDDTPIQAIGGIENYLGSSFPKVFDLDRVEALRGPQGTLFGGGAEGGVLRFITPQPSLRDFSAYARSEASGTQGGSVNYENGIALGGPIVDDKVGFRISVWQRHDGGYTDRRAYTTNDFYPNAGWADSTVARAAMTFAPSDKLTITPSLFYQRVYSNDSNSYWPNLSNPGEGNFVRGNAVNVPTSDSFYLPSLNIAYSFEGVKLTSVTSYFHREADTFYDGTNVAAYVVSGDSFPTLPDVAYYDNTHAYTDQRTWMQETRLQSADPDSKIQWVAGIFYQYNDQSQGETAIDPYLDQFLGFDIGLYLPNSAGIVREHFLLRQVAEFGNVDYKIFDNLTLTAGLRVTESGLDYSYLANGPFSGGLETAAGKTHETPVTPKFGVSWQATPDTLIYFSAAEGYRTGGVNVPVPASYCGADLAALSLSRTPPTYGSDHTWSYEVGAKGRLIDGLIHYDASAYHINWTGVQTLDSLPCGFAFTENAGTAVSNGFDLSLAAKVQDSITLSLALGYDDAHYTSTVKSGASIIAQNGAAIGNPVTGDIISPWTSSFTAQYDLPIYRDYAPYIWAEDDFHSRNTGPFTSMNPAAASYDPTIPANPSTNLIKLRAGFKISDVKISLFVDNLSNAHPQLALQHPFPTSPVYSATTFRPRTIGVNVIYRY